MKKQLFTSFLLWGWLTGVSYSAERLIFEEVLQQALEVSPDLKLSQLDVQMSQLETKKIRSEYLPTLRLSGNTEYLKSFDGNNSVVNTVGGTVFPGTTGFQNSAGVNLNQTLLDFGQRQKKRTLAQQDTQQKQWTATEKRRQLTLKILDIFGNVLLLQKEFEGKNHVVKLSREIYHLKQQLYNAGAISKVDVSDAALQAAKALDELETAKEQLRESLQELSFYTQTPYPETIEIENLSETILPEALVFPEKEQLPEYQTYRLEIEKKNTEREILFRQRWFPSISLYSQYYLYGANRSNYWRAVQNIGQRNIEAGLSISLPIFDGFKTKREREEVDLEIKKLEIEQEKAIQTFQYEYEKVQTKRLGFSREILQKAAIIQENRAKLHLEERLNTQQLLEKTTLLAEQLKLETEKLAFEKTQVEQQINLKKLALYQYGRL